MSDNSEADEQVDPADLPEEGGPGDTLNASEGTDSDELRNDDGDVVVDPPEGWSEANKFGMTAREEREGESLDARLAAEEPDVPDAIEPVEDRPPARPSGPDRRHSGGRRLAVRRRRRAVSSRCSAVYCSRSQSGRAAPAGDAGRDHPQLLDREPADLVGRLGALRVLDGLGDQIIAFTNRLARMLRSSVLQCSGRGSGPGRWPAPR